MDAFSGLVGQLFNMINNLWATIAAAAWGSKTAICVIMVIVVLLYRILMANFLYIKRHDKADWIIWGILMVLQILACFITNPPIWLAVQSLIVVAMGVYWFIADKTKQVKTTIYNNNLVYEDNSEKFAVKDSDKNEAREGKRAREGRIRRVWSKSRTHMVLGIPVLMNKFSFRMSTTATTEQIGKMTKQLSDYYNEYNWRKMRNKRGMRYEVTAEIKIKRNLVVKFDKDISDDLDWYVVPLGAIDVSNKSTAKATPYVWNIHDPKDEGKTYRSLAKTQLYPAAPQGFIVGSTGGGKSVLLNTIIAHFVNKAKTNKQTELYLVDPKRVEFKPYFSLKEVEGVAVTLDEALELTNNFRDKMYERNKMMEKEGIKKIPLNGQVQLRQHININGTLVYGNEVLEFKTTDGQICKDYAMNLNGRTDIAEINMPEPEVEEEKKDDNAGGFSW